MKIILLALLAISQCLSLQAQNRSRFAVEANYGLNGNFFVRSYDEGSSPSGMRFLKKNFIGSIGGLELKYRLTPVSSLSLAYAKSVNQKKITYLVNNGNVAIEHFDIRHTNHFYQLFYERSFSKRSAGFTWQGGIFYLRMNQQEVDVSPFGGSFEQRDYKHNKLEEGGAFAGLHYAKKIDTHFDLGIRTRVYYLISTASLEAITLTPTLTYHF